MTSSVHVPRVGVTAGVAGASSPKRHAATALKETQVLHAHIKRRRTRTSLKACALGWPALHVAEWLTANAHAQWVGRQLSHEAA